MLLISRMQSSLWSKPDHGADKSMYKEHEHTPHRYIEYGEQSHHKTKRNEVELDVGLSNRLIKQNHSWFESKYIDPITDSNPVVNYNQLTSNVYSQINAARNLEEIVKEIKSFGLTTIADRITYLHELAENDPDEVDFDLESLRKLALFFIDKPQLPVPQIVVDADGFSHATWRIPDRGILIMVFLPSDMIKFVGIFQSPEPNRPQWNVRGTLPPPQTLKAMEPFLGMHPTN